MPDPFDRIRVNKSINPFDKLKQQPQVPISNNQPFQITPEMASQKRKELQNQALGFINTSTFQGPRNIINAGAKLALNDPNAEIVPEGGKLGQVLGLIPAGGIVRGALTKVAPKMIGRGLLKTIGRGAVEGALTSQAIQPGMESAVVGATTGAVAEPLVSGGENVYNATLGKSKFLKGVQSEFKNAIKSKKGEFGNFLEEAKVKYPGRSADLTDAVNNLRVNRAYNPDIDRIIEGNSALKRLVDNPQYAQNIPVDEAQNYINYLKSKTSPRVYGQGTKPQDLPLLKTIEDFTESQATGFPEILPQRESYALTKNVERNVGRKFKDESIESSLKSGFPVLVKEKLEKVLGKEAVKKLGGYEQASKFVNLVTNPMTAGGAGIVGAGYLGVKSLRDLASTGNK